MRTWKKFLQSHLATITHFFPDTLNFANSLYLLDVRKTDQRSYKILSSTEVPNLFLLAYPQAEKNRKLKYPLASFEKAFYDIFIDNLKVNPKTMKIWRTP